MVQISLRGVRFRLASLVVLYLFSRCYIVVQRELFSHTARLLFCSVLSDEMN